MCSELWPVVAVLLVAMAVCYGIGRALYLNGDNTEEVEEIMHKSLHRILTYIDDDGLIVAKVSTFGEGQAPDEKHLPGAKTEDEALQIARDFIKVRAR